MTTQRGIVYVAELIDANDPGRLTARFAAHWELLSGEAWRVGPEGVTVEEALAWARRNADIVLIRLGGDDRFYSAGNERQSDLEQWPEEGMVIPPRPTGTRPDETQRTRGWSVEATVRNLALTSDVAADIEGAISRLTAISEASTTLSGEALAIKCVVTAEGAEAAARFADHAVEQAVRQAMGTDLREKRLLDIIVRVHFDDR